MRSARIPTLFLMALMVVLAGLPATAQEEGETTETTVAEEQTEMPYTPAVQVEAESPLEPPPPWTSRYLIPTGLVLAAVAVFITVVQYFRRVVRNRYKVVE